MKIADSQQFAKEGIQALQEVYEIAPKGSSKRCPDRTTLTDFFTDIMHLLGHAEATRLFDIASDHWDEERAK